MEHPGPAGANPEQLRSTQDFVFEAVLGSGNFGVVHRAVRKQDGRTYAIKQVDLRGMTRAEMVDSVKEVQVLASLSSPHCIRYHDSFLDEPSCQLFIVMEYAEGGNLHDAIRKCPADTQLPEAVVWRLLLQMALGLHHMHSRRILHRDVKSMNVFLDGQGNAKIGDVGVAKVLSNTSSMARTVIGTPYYLSPEICQGRPYGAKSDVWALGVVLYECCTRRYPFQANSQYALALKILRGKYPPISGYSYELADVVKRCLTLSAAARPSIARLLSLPSVRAKAATLGIQLPELAGLGAAQRAAAAASTASSRPPPVPSPTQRKAAATAAAAAAAGSPVARQGRSSVQAEMSGSGGSEGRQGKAPAGDQEGSGRAGQKAREERSASSLPFWAPWQTGGSIGGSSDGQTSDALDATVKSGSQLSVEALQEGSEGQRAARRPEAREPISPGQKTLRQRQQLAAGASASPRTRQPAAPACASPTARPAAAACASPTAGAPCSPAAQQSPGRPSSPAAEWLARRAAARAAAAAAKSPEARQPQHPQQPTASAAAPASSPQQDDGSCPALSSTPNQPSARSPEPSGNLQPAAEASTGNKGREERQLGVAADCLKSDGGESGGASGAAETADVPLQRRHQQSLQRAVLPRPVWHWEDA